MHEIRHLPANALIAGRADDPDIRIQRHVSTLEAFPLAPRGGGPIRCTSRNPLFGLSLATECGRSEALQRLATATLIDKTNTSDETPASDLSGVAGQREHTLRQRSMVESDNIDRYTENGRDLSGQPNEKPTPSDVPTAPSLAARYLRSNIDR